MPIKATSIKFPNFTPIYGEQVKSFKLSQSIISVKNLPYVDAQSLYENTPIYDIIATLDSYVAKDRYKYHNVDVKLHTLKKGETPCIPGWHIDGGPDYSGQYVIMVSGVSKTEFYTQELLVPYDKDMPTSVLCKNINVACGTTDIVQLKPWHTYKYFNTSIHRGTPATQDGLRLLIRVMGNDRVRGVRHSSFVPSVY